ncbi:XoxI protein [Priestia aryabhattai]|uniref:XoxI protein n=1 Tax=Priestia aryabhattai TaxID=412384 RepID=UPI003D2DB301
MKVKKSLIAAVAGVSILCFSSGVNAETGIETGSKSIDTAQVLIDPETAVNSDTEVAVPQPDGYTASAATKKYTTNSNTTVHVRLGMAYATSYSKATVAQDYIYVKCRTYNGDGSLIHSNKASEKKSGYVSVKTDNGTAYYGNDYAMGNHTYKKKGYNDINKETKVKW